MLPFANKKYNTIQLDLHQTMIFYLLIVSAEYFGKQSVQEKMRCVIKGIVSTVWDAIKWAIKLCMYYCLFASAVCIVIR